jgi:putative transposase
MSAHGMSSRQACRLMRLHRTVLTYKRLPDRNEWLREKLKNLAFTNPRYGHPMLHDLIRLEGHVVNYKRTERLYKLEGLSLRRKHRKKRAQGLRVARPTPAGPNEVWSMDFVHDRLVTGEKIKCLTLIDQYTREGLVIHVDRAIKGKDVAQMLTKLKWQGRKPKVIVSDNGSEFCSHAMAKWAQENDVRLHFIQPGKPTQNCFTESFNGKFRYDCLDANNFLSLQHARFLIEEWRRKYNEKRPHSSIGRIPPAEFARRFEEKKLNEKSRDQRLQVVV